MSAKIGLISDHGMKRASNWAALLKSGPKWVGLTKLVSQTMA